MNPLLVGGALGALAMYFLDRDAGRRRRARTRDRVLHAARVVDHAARVTARDTVHRARGLAATARHLLQQDDVSDLALVARVRAALGRVVSHPHAIEVQAAEGHVTLDGPILAHEVRPLLKCVRHVNGVRGVSDRLTVYEDAAHVSALQGGRPRRGGRFELFQENWSPAARLLTGTLGAGMLARGARSRGGLGALAGLAGAALVARAACNRPLGALLGLSDASQGIVVHKTIHVDAPVQEVFAFWTDYQNFPRFMHNVREVRVEQDRSHWVVAGPAGVPVEWDSELTRLVNGKLIEWRSRGGSAVKHEGRVRFDAVVGGGTRVNVRLVYVPPAGAFGHAVATLFGADPKTEMDADLMRMKTMIETGRAPHDAAQRPSLPRES